VRRAILFPAIAVDAPGTGWRNAGQDTKGHSWRVAFIYLCVAFPSLLLIILIYFLYMTLGAQGMTDGIVSSVVTLIIQVPTLCAFAAAASHIYRAYANNLARPAETAGPSVAAA
jgi:chromate transport protein ChrA